MDLSTVLDINASSNFEIDPDQIKIQEEGREEHSTLREAQTQ